MNLDAGKGEDVRGVGYESPSQFHIASTGDSLGSPQFRDIRGPAAGQK